MQQLYLNNFFYKDPTTGEFIPIAAIAGESAYELAVRLGKFDGTEEEWNNYIAIERDKAIADIIAKATEAKESIPEDYIALAEQVSGKIDKTRVAQELGDSTEMVVNQKVLAEHFFVATGKKTMDFLENATWERKTIQGTTGLIWDNTKRICTNLIPATQVRRVIIKPLNGYKIGANTYNSKQEHMMNYNFVTTETAIDIGDAYYIRFVVARTDETEILPAECTNVSAVGESIYEKIQEALRPIKKALVKSINHRGYNTIAPENTLPAYVLSKKHGFEYVECDVCFTSDNVPVLLHDDTINRTAKNADGSEISETINIVDITLEQARQYDYRYDKGEAYAGTQIPTFEEFILLCKYIGLKPYVEIKSNENNVFTQECAEVLVEIVKKHGILEDTTWISFDPNGLSKVLEVYPNARVGYVCSKLTEAVVNWCVNKKEENKNVFVDSCYYLLDDETNGYFLSLIDKNIPFEVWDVQSVKDMIKNTYISGFTTNSVVADTAIFDAVMNM